MVKVMGGRWTVAAFIVALVAGMTPQVAGAASATRTWGTAEAAARHVWPGDDRAVAAADLDRIAALGGRFVRADFWWASVEPRPDVFDAAARMRANLADPAVSGDVPFVLASWYELDDSDTGHDSCFTDPIGTIEAHFGVVRTDRTANPAQRNSVRRSPSSVPRHRTRGAAAVPRQCVETLMSGSTCRSGRTRSRGWGDGRLRRRACTLGALVDTAAGVAASTGSATAAPTPPPRLPP